MAFTVLSVILGAALAVGSAIVWRGPLRNTPLVARLPRARVAGEILGVGCLVWSAYYGCLMLEGGLAVYRTLVWALVPVTAVLAYNHLDYLFFRALGGFLVLSASFLLHGAFGEAVPCRGLYSAVCYLVGLWGMGLIAAPWRFRDLLRALTREDAWRHPLGAIGIGAGAVLVALPLLPGRH